MVAIAKAAGFVISAEELKKAQAEVSEEELKSQDQSTGYINEAVAYGVANWYLCNGDTATAESIFLEIIEKANWASFGK